MSQHLRGPGVGEVGGHRVPGQGLQQRVVERLRGRGGGVREVGQQRGVEVPRPDRARGDLGEQVAREDGARRALGVAAQQVEVGRDDEAADRLRRVRAPDPHEAGRDAERVEDVPQGPPPPRGGGDGPARGERHALERPHQGPLGQQDPLAVRAAKPVAGRAQDAVVAREAPGHEGRPDRGALGGPQRRERTEGAPPREADEGGNVPVAGDRHVRGREAVDADHDDATGGTAGVELHRNGRRGRRELRPEGQRHRERRRRGQDRERRRQGPVVAREEGQVEADRQEDGRGTRHHDRGDGERAQRLEGQGVAVGEEVVPVERGRDREGQEGERGEEGAARDHGPERARPPAHGGGGAGHERESQRAAGRPGDEQAQEERPGLAPERPVRGSGRG